MASPLHRHQSSLEGVINYIAELPLETSQRTIAKRSKNTMALFMNDDDENQSINFEELRLIFFGFANYLLDNFFLPFRISTLRGDCLIRDRYRCVITRKFDRQEARSRFNRDGDNARDDNGILFKETSFEGLEVAYILPHSLTKVIIKDPSKEAALAILNMFDNGLGHLIERTDIDRPRNAITLTRDFHDLFGNFDVFFEPVLDEDEDEQHPHTYRTDSFLLPYMSADLALPITRTLYLTDNRTIDPPSPRLLAVHPAGEYIDKLLRDMDEKGIQADGSTELDRILKLRLGSVAG
ncbi:hypothetical protein F4677DRAFT_454958 [Hypoxylon crocopeplum]|nr:hypothetical protein F4677DRAFT_454958 [Hypoxylon crocopeplum]